MNFEKTRVLTRIFTRLIPDGNGSVSPKSSAPQVGFEPTTNWLHITPIFLLGMDYIITIIPKKDFRRLGI